MPSRSCADETRRERERRGVGVAWGVPGRRRRSLRDGVLRCSVGDRRMSPPQRPRSVRRVPSPSPRRAARRPPRQATPDRQCARAQVPHEPTHPPRTSWRPAASGALVVARARAEGPPRRPRPDLGRSPSARPSANHAWVARLMFSPIRERKYVPSMSTSSSTSPSRRARRTTHSHTALRRPASSSSATAGSSRT